MFYDILFNNIRIILLYLLFTYGQKHGGKYTAFPIHINAAIIPISPQLEWKIFSQKCLLSQTFILMD
jgi:hypothetical protein